jgi:hypothetical protein
MSVKTRFLSRPKRDRFLGMGRAIAFVNNVVVKECDRSEKSGIIS